MRLGDLRQRLVALRARFGDVGARAAAAAPDVQVSVIPGETLVEDLRATLVDFEELRRAIVGELSAYPNTPDPTKLSTLKALEAVLGAMERVEAEQVRRAEWEAARDSAVVVLARRIALGPREGGGRELLLGCQARAR